MAMASLSRLFRRAYSISAQPAAIPPASSAAVEIGKDASAKSLCSILNKERKLKRVVELFKHASENERFRTKSGIYETTVRRLAVAQRFRWIEEILEEQKKYRDISKEGFNARLISLYGRYGMADNAQKVFDEMPDRNCKRTVLSFNSLLSAYANSMKFDKVDKVFRELPGKLNIEPDLISYNTVIKAFCDMGSLDSGLSLLDEMEKKGVEPDLFTFNLLLKGSYGNGQFENGERIWALMLEKNVVPDVRSYNAKLNGLALEKRTKDAVELLEQLKMNSIKPDVYSFGSLIRGFVSEDKLDEAKHWYREMWNSDCKPGKSTFVTLIPFVCDKGDFSFAFELSKDAFRRKRLVDEAVLQRVVDGLGKESNVKEAEELVQLGKINGYRRFNLTIPSAE
ncbi:hypothetical protein K2173_004586 [Erythroxylum novogranatense]|uniref:Pentatricopeptide repeat-containing protein n=1 Tax=Erythroxylum novogranatense TaxID=1862640 RepID=A0AAV8T6C1_9ROSI|nr:hypothetical protein K2173_004586 [Erythroxylum novogranatense]